MNTNFKLFLSVLIILSFGLKGLSKNNAIAENTFLSIYTTYGFMPDKEYKYQHLLNGYVKSMNVDVGLKTDGSAFWHSYYGFPETGFSIFYYNLSNKNELGSIVGIIPFIDMKLFNLKKVYPRFHVGIGLCYISKTYNRLTNADNTLIGSHLDAAIRGGFDLQIKLYKNLNLITGISFIHFSNGNTKLPNEGINLISSKAGLKYYFNEFSNQEEIIKIEKKKIEFSFTTAISFTNQRKDLNNGFHYYDFMVEALKPISPIYSVGLGFDYELNNSDTTGLHELEIKFMPTTNRQTGIKVSNTFKFTNFEFVFHVGAHIFDGNKIYDWLIFRYRIYKGLKLNISYKSYLLRGDHLSWGITYTIDY